MKKLILIMGGTTLLAGMGGIAVLAYYGFVPGISDLFGSNKPRDLGVRYEKQDYQNALEKSGIKFDTSLSADAPAENSLKFAGTTEINDSFTDSEVTSFLGEDKWKYHFAPDVQIKIAEDGTAEIAGTLIVNRLYGYAKSHDVPDNDAKPFIDKLKNISSNPPFYLKLKASWENNNLSMDLQTVELGRFQVPIEWIAQNEDAITSFVEDRILWTPGLSINSLTFENGKMNFDGNMPQQISWAPLLP